MSTSPSLLFKYALQSNGMSFIGSLSAVSLKRTVDASLNFKASKLFSSSCIFWAEYTCCSAEFLPCFSSISFSSKNCEDIAGVKEDERRRDYLNYVLFFFLPQFPVEGKKLKQSAA